MLFSRHSTLLHRMASVVLRLFTNIYSYFVVYVLMASWLGSLWAVYLPFRLSLNTDLGLLILPAFSLAPIAGKISDHAYARPNWCFSLGFRSLCVLPDDCNLLTHFGVRVSPSW